jgi:hypothetical protein
MNSTSSSSGGAPAGAASLTKSTGNSTKTVGQCMEEVADYIRTGSLPPIPQGNSSSSGSVSRAGAFALTQVNPTLLLAPELQYTV